MQNTTLTKKKKLGYCSGICAESILYNMFYTYYLFFLTDVAHLAPSLAGTVSLISVFWDAITDPLIGHHADKDGVDKRKLMFKAAFPVGLFFVGAFLPLGETSDVFKFIFYTAMTMMFWLAYTVYTIPYYAVVAEITQDYDERTQIRGTSSMFNTFAILVGNAVPSILPTAFVGIGLTLSLGWTTTAAILALMAIASACIAAKSLAGVKLQKAEGENINQKEKFSFKDYFQILKIKPFRWFVMFVFFFLIASSMIQTNFTYLVKGRLGMSEDDMVIVILTLVVSMGIMIPIVTKVAEKTDRRTASIIFLSIMLVGCLSLKFIGINSIITLILSVFCVAVGLGCFWTVFYSMAYDLVEVDEFVNGKRRESMITAFPQFFQKFGAAIGMWLVGQVLDFSGYDGTLTAQADSAKDAIESIATIIPAAFLLISILGLFLYPVTKKKFAILVEKLEKKKQGEQVDKIGIETLV